MTKSSFILTKSQMKMEEENKSIVENKSYIETKSKKENPKLLNVKQSVASTNFKTSMHHEEGKSESNDFSFTFYSKFGSPISKIYQDPSKIKDNFAFLEADL